MIEKIHNKPIYFWSVTGYTLILNFVAALVFYPINYFTLQFTMLNYFLLFTGVFMGSAVIFHRFILHMYMFVVPEAENKDEKFWDAVSLICYNFFAAPLGGLLIYFLSGEMTYGLTTFVVMIIASFGWYIPLNGLRRELKKNLVQSEKTFVDKEGNTHLLFKL